MKKSNCGARMKICFLVGSAHVSGGTYVINQHAAWLQSQGHEVTIAPQMPFDEQTLAWHPEARKLRHILLPEAANEKFDLVIATWWKTALELPRFDAAQYAYFVQSIESRFYNEREVPLRAFVEKTYALDLPVITEATWIKEYLSERYGRNVFLARNGIRKDVYTPDGPRIAPRPGRGKLRVLVEGPFGVFFKNVGRTVKLARRSGADEVWLMTSSDVQWYPGVDRVFSRVPVEKTAEIYRSCDVIVKLSYVEGMFGPPLEMFHCGGTSIVYAVTGHDEYIVHDTNGLVTASDDEERVVRYINELKNDPDKLERLKREALETAQRWPSWGEASSIFGDSVEAIMQQPKADREALQRAIDDAWREYTLHETERLKRTPSQTLIYKLSALVHRMPPSVSRRLQQARYILESR
ncbi:glycosyltransferase family 4 protein [Burkholderia ubonensis]|uniref:glycosyltransferase family 4 protein n=1 Tax=Burkholderia ubonensis TaxID=101571 RepID=UPI001E3FA51E|nr:glycosyltransferase family 4 protein [Burkholderia ubonensis]